MALDLGDLVGRITLKDEYTPVIDQADRKTSGLGKTMGGVAVGLGVAMAAVGVTAAVGVGALIKTGVSYNAQMSTFETNLGTLLGSAEAGKAMLGDLSAFAASTPFEMPSLAGAAQTLLSFGSTAEDLMPDLKMLGDISLGNSDKMAGLAVVFGQVQSAGRLMGGDVLQMINQGFNPLVEISNRTGESMVDLKKRMEQGKVGFDEVRQAMQDATGPGGQFFEAMAAGALTFDGQMSTLSDGVNILAGALTGELTDSLTGGALPAINEMVSGLTDLVNGVDGAEERIQMAAGNLTAAIQNQVGPAVEGMVAMLGEVITQIAPTLGTIAVTLVNSLAAVIPSLVVVAGDIILALVSALITAAPAMIQAAVPAILALVMGLMEQIPMLVTAALDIVISLVEALIDAVPELIPAAIAMILGIVDALLDALPTLLDVALELIMALAMGLIAAIPDLLAKLPEIIIAIIDFLLDAIPQIIETGIELFIALIEALPQIIVTIVAAIPKIISGLTIALMNSIPALVTAGIKLFLGLIGAMPTIITELVKAIPQIVTELVAAIVDPKTISRLTRAAKDMFGGLWEGMQSVWRNIMDWFDSSVGGMIDTFRDLLGIRSPSRVFREFGVDIGEGLIQGLDKMQPEIDANMTSMVKVPSTSDVSRGTMGASAGNTTHKEYHVHMEASRSTLDEEAIYEALSGPRVP